MASPALTIDQNILPVQALFNLDNTFNTFIGQGLPFYATLNPNQSGLNITNSTINSTVIGGVTPSTGNFTNISTITGQVTSTPINGNDLVNKSYTDALIQGLSFKAPAQVTTTTNITLSGLQTIDGYTTLTGDRVLVKNQTTTSQNGIYNASATAWTRSSDADIYSELVAAFIFIENGTVYTGSAWASTIPQNGTLGTTPITFTQFSNTALYAAGTGLTLSTYTFSITNTAVTAGAYGSTSNTLIATVNSQGQLTSLSSSPIAIANTQVSGLGTISTQNSNAVTITGGTINTATIGQTTAGLITGTTITANTQFTGAGTGLTGTASSLSIGGNAATATSAGSATTATTSTNLAGGAAGSIPYQTASGLTSMLLTGTGVLVGGTTPSYSNAPTLTGTNFSGTASALSIGGNAATATNVAYSGLTGTVPIWNQNTTGNAATATNVAYSGLTGTVPTWNQNTTGTASNVTGIVALAKGGSNANLTASNGGVIYSTASALAISAVGTSGQFLQSNGASAPTWASPVSYATVTDDTTTALTRYPLFASTTSGSLSTEYVSSTKYQYVPSTGVLTATSFTGAGTGLTGTASSLSIGGNATTATTATNIAGGIASQLVYQSSAGTTAFIPNGTTGQVLQSNGATVPTWVTFTGGATITDDTTTNATRYPLFAAATSGTLSTAYTSSTELKYNPSNGLLATPAIQASNGIILNSKTIGTTFSIPSADNAMSVGPITINSGVVITVPSGSRWIVI